MTAPSARVASAASVLFLLGLLSACTDAEPSPRAVAVVQADALVRVTGEEQWLQTPLGQVAVTFGDSTTTTVDGTQARSGEVFVPFKVEDRFMKGVPDLIVGLMDETSPAPEVSLRVGEEAIPLGAASTYRRSSTLDETAEYLRVPEDAADDLSLQVEFDQVTQTVNRAGVRTPSALAGLYGKTKRVAEKCGAWTVADWPEATVSSNCLTEGVRYPYLPGVGWSGDQSGSSTWTVISILPDIQGVVLGLDILDPGCLPFRIRSVELDDSDPSQAISLPLDSRAGIAVETRGKSWPEVTATVSATCGVDRDELGVAITQEIDLNRPEQATRP